MRYVSKWTNPSRELIDLGDTKDQLTFPFRQRYREKGLPTQFIAGIKHWLKSHDKYLTAEAEAGMQVAFERRFEGKRQLPRKKLETKHDLIHKELSNLRKESRPLNKKRALEDLYGIRGGKKKIKENMGKIFS